MINLLKDIKAISTLHERAYCNNKNRAQQICTTDRNGCILGCGRYVVVSEQSLLQHKRGTLFASLKREKFCEVLMSQIFRGERPSERAAMLSSQQPLQLNTQNKPAALSHVSPRRWVIGRASCLQLRTVVRQHSVFVRTQRTRSLFGA